MPTARRTRTKSKLSLPIHNLSIVRESEECMEEVQAVPGSSKPKVRSLKKPLKQKSLNTDEENDVEIENILAVENEKTAQKKEGLRQLLIESTSYEEAVIKACDNAKGQKSLIKQLARYASEVVDECSVNTLLRTLWESSFTSNQDGVKFCAQALQKIGAKYVVNIIRQLIKGNTTSSHCSHLGDVISMAWRNAMKAGEEEWSAVIQNDIVTEIAHDAIFLKEPYCSRFLQVLSTFGFENGRKAQYDDMLTTVFSAVLWRGIKAQNDIVRLNASVMMLRFFPIVAMDQFENTELLEKQYNGMALMLKDDCTQLRIEATKKILRILANMWDFVPKHHAKIYMSTIVDELSMDSHIPVRIAVYESISFLIPVSQCMSTVQHTLECISERGINDKNERVRIAAFRMLMKLKPHRYIKFFDVIPYGKVLARLEIETSEAVRKEIIPLIFNSFFPSIEKFGTKERFLRIGRMIAEGGRVCALSFHRLLYPLNLITVKEAATHIKYLTVYVYNSSKNGFPADVTIEQLDNSTLDETVMSLSGPSQEMIMPDENNPQWVRNKAMVECIVVMWMSIRKRLSELEFAAEKEMLEKLESKMFKKCFQCYRSSSLIGTTMVLGSLIDPKYTDGITQSVLTLLNEKVVDEAVIEPYLEATAQWRIDTLFDLIAQGLDLLKTQMTEIIDLTSPPRKKQKPHKIDSNQKPSSNKLSPVDQFSKALHYLQYLMRSYGVSQCIKTAHDDTLELLYRKLHLVRNKVNIRLSVHCEEVGLPDDLIIKAFETKQTLAAILLHCRTADDYDPRVVFERDLSEDLAWFEGEVFPKINADTQDFLIPFSEMILRSVSHIFAVWEFGRIEERTYRSMGDDEIKLEPLPPFPELAVSLIQSFLSSSTPAEIMPSVFNAAKELVDSNAPGAFECAVCVLEYAPQWIMKRIQQDEPIDEKKVPEALYHLWRVVMSSEKYTPLMMDTFMGSIMKRVLVTVIDENENISRSQLVGSITTQLEYVQSRALSHPGEDHTYEAPLVVQLLVHKVMFRNAILIDKFVERVGVLSSQDQLLPSSDSPLDCLIRLGSIAQLVHLADCTRFGPNRTNKSTRVNQKVAMSLRVLRERLKEVEGRDMDGEERQLLNEVEDLVKPVNTNRRSERIQPEKEAEEERPEEEIEKSERTTNEEIAGNETCA